MRNLFKRIRPTVARGGRKITADSVARLDNHRQGWFPVDPSCPENTMHVPLTYRQWWMPSFSVIGSPTGTECLAKRLTSDSPQILQLIDASLQADNGGKAKVHRETYNACLCTLSDNRVIRGWTRLPSSSMQWHTTMAPGRRRGRPTTGSPGRCLMPRSSSK